MIESKLTEIQMRVKVNSTFYHKFFNFQIIFIKNITFIICTLLRSSKYLIKFFFSLNCFGGLEKDRSLFDVKALMINLSTFSTDTTGQLDVLWHDGDALSVDGAQVGVFEETDEVSFGCFLKGHDG